MDVVLKQVECLASCAKEEERKRIIGQLRDLSYSLESPDDTLHRVIYLHLQTAAIRIGINLKIFNMLVASKEPMSLEQLHHETGAARVLLCRLLRYMASIAVIKETGKDTYAATNITGALAIPGNQSGVIYYFDSCSPVFQELPGFLERTNYQDITDNAHTVHQAAFKSEGPVFQWLTEHPEKATYFSEYMAHRRETMPSWIDVFPIAEEAETSKSDVLFVDMGGNMGHECARLKARYPDLPGRVILQDLPYATSLALETPGVENTEHDLFTPQPVKGAKFYYIRAVLHDFPDEECRIILRNVRDAMGEHSVLLVDEMVLPDTNVHFHATQCDLLMMSALAAIERTRNDWADLLDSVGLTILETLTYTPSVYESVMVVVRKDRE